MTRVTNPKKTLVRGTHLNERDDRDHGTSRFHVVSDIGQLLRKLRWLMRWDIHYQVEVV